jgi:hypothetical protein
MTHTQKNHAPLVAVVLLVCSFSAMAAPFVGQAKPAAADSPTALVKELYRVHNNGRGPILTGKNRAVLQKFFDKKLADLLWKILTAKSDEVGPLDFDPFFNAQDTEISNFLISAAVGNDQDSTVTVTFRNAGSPETIKFRLHHTEVGWRVANIVYADGSDLIKILSSPQ